MSAAQFRRGDFIEVKTASEILATLDGTGACEGLPFMPEMARYCGRRFLVERRADKICDTVKLTGSRKLPNAVLLADLRCDGSAHGGCQAECRFFWKDAWLREVSAQSPAPAPQAEHELGALLERTSQRLSRTVTAEDGRAEERWSCQATSLFGATQRVSTFDPRAYLNEYLVGNVPLERFVRITARAAWEEPARKFGLTPAVYMSGPSLRAPADEPLNLKPGELVEVKSEAEIRATLNPTGHNRGLWFDREMMAFCGKTFRVRRRVNRFIDDYRDGRMVELKSDAVTLEGVACTGDLSQRRWFCPRHAIPYWRECWLRRVTAGSAVPSGHSGG